MGPDRQQGCCPVCGACVEQRAPGPSAVVSSEGDIHAYLSDAYLKSKFPNIAPAPAWRDALAPAQPEIKAPSWCMSRTQRRTDNSDERSVNFTDRPWRQHHDLSKRQ